MKRCGYCGVDYGKRPSEAYWQFSARRFCSRSCADKGRTRVRVPDEEFKARYRQVKINGRPRLEHRHVVEQALGRPLERHEQVHHKNRNRLDNRLENLEVVSSAEHGLRHTFRAITSSCVICGTVFTPSKTKRERKQTCSPACKSALLSLRNAERKAAHLLTLRDDLDPREDSAA